METRSSPSIKKLRSLAVTASLTNFETLSKAQLFETIRKSHDINRLERIEARLERRKVAESDTSATPAQTKESQTSSSKRARSRKSKAHKKKNEQIRLSLVASIANNKMLPVKKALQQLRKRVKAPIDPIMLTEIEPADLWTYQRSKEGGLGQFNMVSLIDYMLSSGDFSDPETRVPFSDEALSELDAVAQGRQLGRASVLQAKRSPKQFEDLKFRRDALCGLERCAGEVVSNMLHLVESDVDDIDCQIRLLTEELPQFSHYFTQLIQSDPKYAQDCATHWRSFLRGPENRPTVDSLGLVKMIIARMNSMLSCSSETYTQEEVESEDSDEDGDEDE